MIGSAAEESDLWVVPPPTHSAWFSRLDWYLNWQMCKGQSHRPAAPKGELTRIAEEYGLEIHDRPKTDKAPLMIGSQGLIPVKACLVLGYKGELKDWLLEAKTVAFKLQAARVRVFLPPDADKDKAAKTWEKLSGDCTADFIEDDMENA